MKKQHIIRFQDSHAVKDLWLYEDNVYEIEFANKTERYCISENRAKQIVEFYKNAG